MPDAERVGSSVECDVLVVGSGAGGLTAALSARILGLDVIVAEAEPMFGGTTARSGGVLWIPGNHYAERAGIKDSREAARTYLRHELGNRYNSTNIEAFLDDGPEVLRFLEQNSEVKFTALMGAPDYHPDVAGAVAGGRSLRIEVTDASLLGDRFRELAWPIPETMLFGGMMIAGGDHGDFLAFSRSWRSFLRVSKLVAGFARDKLKGGRGRRLANGNALVARLAKSCFDRGVPLWLNSPVTGLKTNDTRVVGAVVRRPEGLCEVSVRRGVVLAAGGFSNDDALRGEFFDGDIARKKYSMAAASSDGAGVRLARSAGAEIETDTIDPTIYVPASLLPGEPKKFFPHLLDRNKPGMIVVNRHARRFISEASSYQDFVGAMIADNDGEAEVFCYLICDHRAIRLYGFGPVRPFPLPMSRWINNGYLKRGRSLRELATQLGLDGDALEATVKAYNSDAETGVDRAFHKGETVYERSLGDPSNKPNPNFGAVATAPFYGVRLLPGDIATTRGLRTDEFGRVLGAERRPIGGLYAVGNDMANIMAGAYPGGGSTLGPGMTFAYRAAKHIASSARASDATPQRLQLAEATSGNNPARDN